MKILDDIIFNLHKLWLKTPVMKIFIPNWDEYSEIYTKQDLTSNYQSLFLEALIIKQIDYLINILNFFCIDSNYEIKLTKQYIKDLNELMWLKENEEIKKYIKFNIFYGKFIEFLISDFFRLQNYQIINMQAWDINSPDIVIKKDGKIVNIEVKWVPQYKESFEKQLKGKTNFFLNTTSAHRHLILDKILPTIHQLKNKKNLDEDSVAIIVIDEKSIAAYFLDQETMLKRKTICYSIEKEVIKYQEDIYKISELDKVMIFSAGALTIKHWYTFDIKNKRFYNIQKT